MAQVLYGVWNGAVHDNRPGKDDHGVPPPELRDFEQFDEGNGIRAFVGDRGFFVFDETVSLIDTFWHYMDKAAEQSCGKCTPCRMGTVLVRDALGAMRRGLHANLDLDQLATLAEQIRATSLCGVGQTCASALEQALAHFRDRFEEELKPAKPMKAQHGMAYMTAPCIEACPSKVNVPRYIDYIRDGKPEHSLGVILQKYPMAATCSRVCVRFCEQACRRNLVDEAVGIKILKRYVAEHQTGPHALAFKKDMIAHELPADMKVAVVGTGPAGVSCAYHLLLHGYHVDVFEAMSEAGGMAAIGIPSYRLPKDVLLQEMNAITNLGGTFHFNQALGKDFSVDDLYARGYKAVFLGLGCQEGTLLGCAGEDRELVGYESGIGFLLKVHDHVAGIKETKLDGEIVVVGGGNVAMDCVRSAIRMGAKKVHLVYRRTEADMPADHEEIVAAHDEGIEFHVLTNPIEILSEKGKVVGVKLTRMEQTEVDAKGRRNVRAVAGSEFVLPCSIVIAAIGQQVNTTSIHAKDGVEMSKWNWVVADKNTLATSRPGVFAGGDCYSGPSTLIQAMANGLKAARSIDDFVRLGSTRFFPRSRMREIVQANKMLASDCIEVPVKNEYRVHHPELSPEVRRTMFGEVEQVISSEDAYRESMRCMRCYRIYSVITEHAIPEGAA
jgi:formate dehydrogenase (NADP+) beta subunit